MDLKYDDLQAFLGVYQAGTFSKASKSLGLTQSALSQKIARIEDRLQAAIFVRHPRALSLTASGEKLLIYAKEVIERQRDFLSAFDQDQNELSGVIRIAGYSSIMRSMIIPKLSPFLRKNPKVTIEFSSHEMFELEDILKSNKADFIITDKYPDLTSLVTREIAKEEYVIIKSKKYKNIPNTFLDHGPFDNATESYFKHIGRKIDYERGFMGDVYAIIDGVAQGLGYAVMSKHIIENDSRFLIEKASKKYTRPVVLSHFEQSYYSPVFQKILETLS